MYTLKSLFDNVITNLKIINTILNDTEEKYDIYYVNLKHSAIQSLELINGTLKVTSKIADTHVIVDYDEDVNYLINKICDDITCVTTNMASKENESSGSVGAYRLKQYIFAILLFNDLINKAAPFSTIIDVFSVMDYIDRINIERTKIISYFDIDPDGNLDKKYVVGLIKLATSNIDMRKLLLMLYVNK